MEQRTKGQPAGEFMSVLYELLARITLEASCSEQDDEFVEEGIQTLIDAVERLAPSDNEWDSRLKLPVGDGMVFEIETTMRLRPEREGEFQSK